MNNMDIEMNEFIQLLNELDIGKFDMVDQLKCALAFGELVQKVKPILLKYAAKDQTITNFLFKM